MEQQQPKELSTRAAVGVLALWGALMRFSYRRDAARRGQAATGGRADRSAVLKRRECWVDHPLAAWLFENGAVFLLVMVRALAQGRTKGRRGWQLVLRIFLGIAAAERLQLVLHWVLTHKVYSHIPYFYPGEHAQLDPASTGFIPDPPAEAGKHGPQQAAESGALARLALPGVPRAHGPLLSQIAREFARWSMLSQVLVSSIALVEGTGTGKGALSTLRSASRIKLLPFLAKLAIARVVVDVAFGAGHWLIHRPALFASRAVYHKAHHEHHHPSVLTNQHFTVPDIFIEAYLPSLLGLVTLARLGIKLELAEISLIMSYIGWQEACTHSGKPVPFGTMLAPVAPLYNSALGCDWDRRNVEFHQVHHERVRCNYSITQWFDHLLGTSRWG